MITLKLEYKSSEEAKDFIHDLSRKQSAMIRSAFALSKKGLSEKEIRAELKVRFSDSELDSWFRQSSVIAGIGMVEADEELGVKKRIFGGKRNFIRRVKGLISNVEWKELRVHPIYLIGEAQYGGNRKFEFGEDSILFKPYRASAFCLILPPLKKNYRRKYKQMLALTHEKKIPITVFLTARYICISFDETRIEKEQELKKPISTRYAGFDLNPNYIGVSVFDGEKLFETKLFDLKELTGKETSDDKRLHETREIAHDISRFLSEKQVHKVFIEDLNFASGDKGKGRNYNRLTQNQWSRNAFTFALAKHHKLYKINAAYTSTIGNILCPELPDPIAASTAIAERGYRILILKNKQFYPALPSITYLKDLWKETEIPEINSWKELHSWVKNSGVKYRVPIPVEWVFRKMSSVKSKVNYINHSLV